MDKKTGVFFLAALNVGQKKLLKFGEDLFFFEITSFRTKKSTQSEQRSKNLDQDRLIFFPVSKTDPPPQMQIPGYAPDKNPNLKFPI